MTELQIAIGLAVAAFVCGVLVMAILARFLSGRALGTAFLMPSTVVLYDHDGHLVHAVAAEASHWLQKGYVRKWVSDEQVPSV